MDLQKCMGTGMGELEDEGTGMGVGAWQDDGPEMIGDNYFDYDAYYASLTYTPSADLQPLDIYELPMGPFPPLGDYIGASSTFEERQAALVAQVLDQGMPCNDPEAVDAHVQPTELLAIDQGMLNSCEGFNHKSINIAEPAGEVVDLRPRSINKLPTVSTISQGTVGSNEWLPKNIYPVATEFLSSPTSCSDSVSSSMKKDFDEKKQNEYRRKHSPAIPFSVNSRTVGARRRRDQFREKLHCLEKLVPLQTKLNSATVLEEASKYVKFLEAQVHVLERMPSCMSPSNDLGSGGIEKPTTKVITKLPSTSNTFGKRGGMSSSEKFNVGSVTSSLEQQTFGENFSTQQVLQGLVTSRAFQRKLFSEGKCLVSVQQYQMLGDARGSHN